jgi:hypothetical protein
MAGRKQHFIPQALQRGFGVAKGKKTQVYVFKKGQEPYNSSTEGVAAQRDFYSEPSDEQTLDDKITTYEATILAPAVAALRESPAGPIEPQLAAAVVVHLSIRSAFVRGSFSVAATELLDYFADSMSTHDGARALLELDSLKSESTLVKAIEEDILSKFGSMPESGRNALGKLAHFRAREKFPQMFPALAAMVLQQFEVLLDKLPRMIGSGHSKALEKDLVPQPRVDRLKAMRWKIIAIEPPAHFVLPDCLALGSKTSDFKVMEPYSLVNDEELAGVVMPVSSSKVLVGSVGDSQLDLEELNRAFAQCSQDFFISSRSDAETAEAAQLIGDAVANFVDRVVVGEVFAAPAMNGSEQSRIEEGELDPITMPINFEPSSRKSNKAEATIRALLTAPQLQPGLRTVKSIVVADNIAHSLRERGVDLNEYGAQLVKLGTCHTSETPNGVASELFFTAESVDLVANGHPLARAAAALIRHQAGRATYYATVAAKIPKEVLYRPRSQLEALGLRLAHFFCSHYFGGRLCGMGPISDEEFAVTDAFLSQILGSSIQGITNARLHFIEHRDVNAAMSLALIHLEQMLIATASACATTVSEAHRWKTSKSIRALKAVSLSDWFDLFARDLERFFDARERITSDSELVLLGGHIERVLWSFGIVLGAPTPGEVWLEVLTNEQLENTRAMLRA